MHEQLECYFNDHLAGSSGALLVIEHLIETYKNSTAGEFFQILKAEVEEDRALLERLLNSDGMQASNLKKAAGNLTARAGVLKLMWEGFEPGELGRLEGLEMLALGVQGKRMLWATLQEISVAHPAWGEINFSDLELKAIRQRDGIEAWRIDAARSTFINDLIKNADMPTAEHK